MPSKEYLEEKAKRDKGNANSGKIIAATFIMCFIAVAAYIVMYGQ
ncbi:hypothetical protein MNB_SM-4-1106 [hydrothermal vent metagenome]|uniref:Uncharacterized protein n=1 Tax=hydrothermal vent metagenome TaxID=652676 RepID=A0A1W1BU20_9ZZZZ